MKPINEQNIKMSIKKKVMKTAKLGKDYQTWLQCLGNICFSHFHISRGDMGHVTTSLATENAHYE